MKSGDIREHILSTYIKLRLGMVVFAALLPFVLWIGGRIFADLPLQGSISAYYHAGHSAMRDVFVGVLFAVGIFLYLYKGYSPLENWALNFAAIFVVGVAIFPMQWDCGETCSKISLHGSLAVLFFLSIGYVCIFRSGDTLDLMKDKVKAARYKKAYKLQGTAMVVLPLIAVALSWLLRRHSEWDSTIFLVETVGVLVFASYWCVKTLEIKVTNSESLAMDRRLKMQRYKKSDFFKQVSLEHVQ
jgi:hypothetical protein